MYYTLQNEPIRTHVDAETLIYTVDVVFERHDGEYDPGEEISQSHWTFAMHWDDEAREKIPISAELEFKGKNVYGTSVSSYFFAYLTSKEVISNRENYVHKIRCTYKGRPSPIVLDCTPSTQFESQRIFQSVKEQDIYYGGITAPITETTGYKGIGVDFEGTNRIIPVLYQDVRQVVGLYNLDEYLENARLMASSVNESGWNPPWADTTSIAEAQWMYMGISDTTIDRGTRTCILNHRFMKRIVENRQDKYSWYTYREYRDEEGRLTRDIATTPEYAIIYKTAGTDKWFDDATDIPPFSDLGLTKPVVLR